MTKPFIYIWLQKSTEMWYLGCHYKDNNLPRTSIERLLYKGIQISKNSRAYGWKVEKI
jgi:hypothetical protein